MTRTRVRFLLGHEPRELAETDPISAVIGAFALRVEGWVVAEARLACDGMAAVRLAAGRGA